MPLKCVPDLPQEVDGVGLRQVTKKPLGSHMGGGGISDDEWDLSPPRAAGDGSKSAAVDRCQSVSLCLV